MNPRILQLCGALILLGCAVFATLRLKSADAWSGAWMLVVALGVAITLIGTIVGQRANRRGKR